MFRRAHRDCRACLEPPPTFTPCHTRRDRRISPRRAPTGQTRRVRARDSEAPAVGWGGEGERAGFNEIFGHPETQVPFPVPLHRLWLAQAS